MDRLILLNGHGGNVASATIAALRLRTDQEMLVAYPHWLDFGMPPDLEQRTHGTHSRNAKPEYQELPVVPQLRDQTARDRPGDSHSTGSEQQRGQGTTVNGRALHERADGFQVFSSLFILHEQHFALQSPSVNSRF